MAEENPDGGWLGGWLQTAKEKTSSALEFVKNDLTEFTSVVSCDTNKAAVNVKNKLTSENVTAATAKARRGVSTIIGGISKVLIIEAEDLDDPGIPITKDGVYDRKEARLRIIQLDSGTYLNEPTGPNEQFEMWLPSFNIEEKKGDISELLVANVEVRALYTRLVPSTVSHADFWQRYFYKLHQLQQDEWRKQALMKRADVSQETKDLAWDEDDEWGDIVGSPPKSSHINTLKPQEETEDKKSAELASTSVATTEKDDEEEERLSQCKETATLPNDNPQPEAVTDTKPVVSHDEIDTPTSTSTPKEINNEETNNASSIEIKTESVDTKTESVDDKLAEKDVKEGARNDDGSSSSDELKNMKMKDKGDLVVVGSSSSGTTPSCESVGSSNTTGKESSGLDDEWDQDFDIEVTEEDLKLIDQGKHEKLLDEIKSETDNDDWENWE